MSWQRWLAIFAVAVALGLGLVRLRGTADRWVAGLVERIAERSAALAEARFGADIPRAMQQRATGETAAFVEENLLTVPSFAGRFELLEYSVRAVDPKLKGLYCEFGVATGETINFVSRLTTEPVHGFDSFEGLPETWRDGYAKGAFARMGLPPVRSNVVLHKGWFKDTLPGFRNETRGPLAFVHMDADLYSSTKDVLDLMGDRMVAGTVIQFDEYFNYPGWRQHEFRAFQEFVRARGVRFEYLGYSRSNQQVAVRILSIDGVKPRGGGYRPRL